MRKTEMIIVADYSETSLLTLQDMCDICKLSSAAINDFIKHDILHPIKNKKHEYFFNTADIKRIQMALRLQNTFDLTLPALALVLTLLDERNALIERNTILERHLFWQL